MPPTPEAEPSIEPDIHEEPSPLRASAPVTVKLRLSIHAGDDDLIRVATEALHALLAHNDPAVLFESAAVLGEVVFDRETRAPRIDLLDDHGIRWHLARSANWYKEFKSARSDARPPIDIAKQIRRFAKDFPLLRRIVSVPVFTASGKLVQTEGYDRDGELWYAPSPGFAIPPVSSNPTPLEITAAREFLVGNWLADFPFVSEADRAHTVAALLLSFARDLIDGPTPLHLVFKPAPGTGATLVVQLIGYVVAGAVPTAFTEPGEEREMRKQLITTFASNPSIFFIDNANQLDSASLSAAITAGVYSGRLITKGFNVRAVIRCLWIATGNNPRLTTELARRTVPIHLDAKMERPWERDPKSFRHPDIFRWTAENRARLVHAALTLIQAWIAAGRPEGTATLGGMESWSRVIGGILKVAGIEGFLGNLDAFYGARDDETKDWSEFVQAWWKKFGDTKVSSGELLALLVREEISIDLGSGNDRSIVTTLGKLLASREGRVFDGYRIVRLEKKNQGAARWKLESTIPAAAP